MLTGKLPKELFAPEGKLWVCVHCGKESDHKYGGTDKTSYGWDGSCMLNSYLFDEDKLARDNKTGLIVRIRTEENGHVDSNDP